MFKIKSFSNDPIGRYELTMSSDCKSGKKIQIIVGSHGINIIGYIHGLWAEDARNLARMLMTAADLEEEQIEIEVR